MIQVAKNTVVGELEKDYDPYCLLSVLVFG